MAIRTRTTGAIPTIIINALYANILDTLSPPLEEMIHGRIICGGACSLFFRRMHGLEQRVQLCVTVENCDGKPFIVFHEAKHFSNPALRAKGAPAVLAQIVRYQATLRQHDATLRQRYVAVCQTLVRLHTMRTAARAALPARPLLEPDPLVAAIASGQVQAEIDPDPRLIVFGFDGDQRDGRWERDVKRLREHQPSLKIRAIGNTRSAREFF